YDSQNLRQGQTWTAVLEVLNEAESDEFIFTYTLQTVNDDKDEYSYEYDGPLLALQDEFQVTADNDIALLNKPVTIAEDTKMNIPSGHHDENTELDILSGHHDDDTEMNTSSGHHDDDTEMDITSEHLNEEALTDEQQKIQDFLSSVAGNMLRLTKEKSIMKLSKEAHAEIQKAQTDSELAALSIDPETIINLRHYMEVQSAFAGSTQHTDPFVNLCRALLDTKVVRKHEQAQVLDRSTCGLFLRCLITFLDSQINGAVFMLQRTLRKIPLADKFTNQLKMQEIVKELESIKTSAGILIDIMGFRKTYTTLLFLSYYALYTPHTHMDGTLDHRLIICIVLSGIVLNQWQTVIVKYFPHLHLIIGQGDQPTDKKYAQR
ncbi:hypothetical protein MMC24_007981, partial [Lignoscripta atroalba]|nr:hypothetical protein [Lignoscripta atroalba]